LSTVNPVFDFFKIEMLLGCLYCLNFKESSGFCYVNHRNLYKQNEIH